MTPAEESHTPDPLLAPRVPPATHTTITIPNASKLHLATTALRLAFRDEDKVNENKTSSQAKIRGTSIHVYFLSCCADPLACRRSIDLR